METNDTAPDSLMAQRAEKERERITKEITRLEAALEQKKAELGLLDRLTRPAYGAKKPRRMTKKMKDRREASARIIREQGPHGPTDLAKRLTALGSLGEISRANVQDMLRRSGDLFERDGNGRWILKEKAGPSLDEARAAARERVEQQIAAAGNGRMDA